MSKRLTAARLSELGTAAAVGIHVDGVQHCAPFEIAAMVEEIIAARALVVHDPVAEVDRSLKDGSRYRIAVAKSCVVLTLSHPDAALEPVEVLRLRADLDSVASSIGAKRG